MGFPELIYEKTVLHLAEPFLYLIITKPAAGSDGYGPAFCKAFLYIQDPLIAAAPEGNFQALLGHQEGTINQNVNGCKKLFLVFRAVQKLLKGIT